MCFIVNHYNGELNDDDDKFWAILKGGKENSCFQMFYRSFILK